MQADTKNLIKLHLIVFIYGFTAILGKLITLDAILLVWYRMFIAFIAIGCLLIMQKKSMRIERSAILRLGGIGLIVALHWITFFYSVKVSTISVALGCLASTTLFTSFLEPIFTKRRLILLEVITGFIIILGLYTIFRFEPGHIKGIVFALTSAFLAGLFTVLNKLMISKNRPMLISFYEMGSGFIGITIFLWINGTFNLSLQFPTGSDWLYLSLLGIVCTAYAFAASVKVMETLSAYTVVLTINLEPIYGILLAFAIFGETELMSGGFYLGTIIILLAVFLYPIISRKLTALK